MMIRQFLSCFFLCAKCMKLLSIGNSLVFLWQGLAATKLVWNAKHNSSWNFLKGI